MEWVGCIIQLDFPTSKINGQGRDHCCQPQVSLNFASSYNHYIETHALSFVDWPVLFQPAVVYSLYITGTGSCVNAVSLLVSWCIVQGAECVTAFVTNSIYTELQTIAFIFRSLKMQQWYVWCLDCRRVNSSFRLSPASCHDCRQNCSNIGPPLYNKIFRTGRQQNK